MWGELLRWYPYVLKCFFPFLNISLILRVCTSVALPHSKNISAKASIDQSLSTLKRLPLKSRNEGFPNVFFRCLEWNVHFHFGSSQARKRTSQDTFSASITDAGRSTSCCSELQFFYVAKAHRVGLSGTHFFNSLIQKNDVTIHYPLHWLPCFGSSDLGAVAHLKTKTCYPIKLIVNEDVFWICFAQRVHKPFHLLKVFTERFVHISFIAWFMQEVSKIPSVKKTFDRSMSTKWNKNFEHSCIRCSLLCLLCRFGKCMWTKRVCGFNLFRHRK